MAPDPQNILATLELSDANKFLFVEKPDLAVTMVLVRVKYYSQVVDFDLTEFCTHVRNLRHQIAKHPDIGLPTLRQRLIYKGVEWVDDGRELHYHSHFQDGDVVRLEDRAVAGAGPTLLMGDFAAPFLASGFGEEATFSDVDVVCQNKTFKAHKLILAGRSEVFKQMLTNSSFKEARENRIVIEKDQSGSEVEPYVVKLLLKFIYEDMIAEAELSEDVAWQLLDLAKMYQLDRLAQICLKRLFDAASASNSSAWSLLIALNFFVASTASMVNVMVYYKSRRYPFLSVSRNATFGRLRRLIAQNPDIGVPVVRQRLIYMGEEMTDDDRKLPQNTFAVLCEKKTAVEREPTSPPTLLMGDFATPFLARGSGDEEDVRFSDVVVVCQDKTFKAHKIILAGRSEVFDRMLSSSFKEGKENVIEIRDSEPRVVYLLLNFIHRDKIDAEDMDGDVAAKLFNLAKMYQIDRLAQLCLNRMIEGVTVENSCSLLAAASAYDDAADCFETILQFMRENKAQVFETEGWRAMDRDFFVKICQRIM